eukprot:15270977-Alexandrium_andersonii.AAC.1
MLSHTQQSSQESLRSVLQAEFAALHEWAKQTDARVQKVELGILGVNGALQRTVTENQARDEGWRRQNEELRAAIAETRDRLAAVEARARPGGGASSSGPQP